MNTLNLSIVLPIPPQPSSSNINPLGRGATIANQSTSQVSGIGRGTFFSQPVNAPASSLGRGNISQNTRNASSDPNNSNLPFLPKSNKK